MLSYFDTVLIPVLVVLAVLVSLVSFRFIIKAVSSLAQLFIRSVIIAICAYYIIQAVEKSDHTTNNNNVQQTSSIPSTNTNRIIEAIHQTTNTVQPIFDKYINISTKSITDIFTTTTTTTDTNKPTVIDTINSWYSYYFKPAAATTDNHTIIDKPMDQSNSEDGKASGRS